MTGSIKYILIALLIALSLNTAAMFFLQRPLFYVSLALTLSSALLTLLHLRGIESQTYQFVTKLADSLESAGSSVLTNFSLPVVQHAHFILDENAREALSAAGVAELRYEMRHYAVYRSVSEIDSTEYAIYYFVDETKLRRTAAEYGESRPVIAYIAIDNLDELLAGAKESEKAALTGQIEKEIENFAASTTGVCTKTSGGRFIMTIEERHLRVIADGKFDILNRVRALSFGEKGSPTLSIGVGRGSTLHESEEMARSALDMALGRGGDQAAVKSGAGDFKFYGGVSKGVERRTRVRSRVVAQAVRELIEGSDSVLIMGHRFADLDSFGAAVGFYSVCRKQGKPARIVMTRSTSLALPLLTRLEEQGFENFVSEPADILPFITKKTLLLVVDTHRGDFVDSEEVYRACETVVVVDHHRKTVNYIDNAVIFYHEPFSSSTCEMVAELVQYMGEGLLGRHEAEALLAGIMLDTRNFVLRTGVRSFEAAAYLRSRGADPVEVKRLFSGSMDTYRERAAIVAAAELYKNCAISVVGGSDFPDLRLATSQAADDLLTISAVDASFVIYEQNGGVNISARSMGAVNVQLIMEALGGGGHQTMAAAQLPCETPDSAKMQLMAAIDGN